MNARPDPRQAPSDWESLRLLNSYRLFVVIVLLAGFLTSPGDIAFGRHAPGAFYVATTAYAALAVLFAVGIRRRWPDHQSQCYTHFYTDIILLGVIIHASGGVASGLGILLVVPVASAGTLLQARYSLVYAALATLMLLTSEVVRHMDLGIYAAAYTQAAVLGIAFFATAILARVLAQRHAQSAALARERSEDLRRLAALNERIIQQMEAGILVVAPDGRIQLANASARLLLGRSGDITGVPLAELSRRLQSAVATFRESGRNPVKAIAVGTDSQLRRLQVQLTDLDEQGTMIMLEDAAFIESQVQQLKLASLGRLTAGIAHEIRNPLAAINHSAQLLAEDTDDEAEARLVQIQLEHCQRINAIVESILQLTRQRSNTPEELDLSRWLSEFVEEFRRQHDLDGDRLALAWETDSRSVACQPDQLNQVLTNLCQNCLQHARTGDGSPVRIAIRVTLTSRGYPAIDVIDNGKPIPRDLVEELFEPFYTSSRAGTGLGLFLARELCQANGAELHYVDTEAGNCMRITFPERTETEALQHG